MSQDDFASKIDISRSNLGNIEIGRIAVTDRVISSICREYNINEEWLRNGTGDMFVKVSAYEKAYNRFGYIMENSSPSKKAALSMLLELLYSVPDDTWDEMIKKFEEIKKEG